MRCKPAAALIHRIDHRFGSELYASLIHWHLGFHTPYYRFPKRKMAFIHLPKTAGTSLHTLLGEDPLMRFTNLNVHRPLSRFCKPSSYSYFTVLRHPADRVWSHYRMILGSPHSRFHHAAEKGLEYYLKHCWMGRNMSCRYYTGAVKKEPDSTTLRLALDNLSNFRHILFFERIGEDIAEFLATYDLPAQTIPHERKVSYDQPTGTERDQIRLYNELDIELYQTIRNQHGLDPDTPADEDTV